MLTSFKIHGLAAFALAAVCLSVTGCNDSSKADPPQQPPTVVITTPSPSSEPDPQPADDAPTQATTPDTSPPSTSPAFVPPPDEPKATPPPTTAKSEKRSPYPAEGESIEKPIKVPQLADVERPPLPESGVVPWTQAHHFVDQRITVEGQIVNTYNHRGNICFLNFSEDWRGKFYIPVFKEVFPEVPDGKKPEDFYLNKTLQITGKVTLHQGRTNIEVHNIKQLKVIE